MELDNRQGIVGQWKKTAVASRMGYCLWLSRQKVHDDNSDTPNDEDNR
jgi:hypothetical protein